MQLACGQVETSGQQSVKAYLGLAMSYHSTLILKTHTDTDT